jgi:hypothetical protein
VQALILVGSKVRMLDGVIGGERGATMHTRMLTILGSPRNGDRQVVDTMSAEGRSFGDDHSNTFETLKRTSLI